MDRFDIKEKSRMTAKLLYITFAKVIHIHDIKFMK